MSSFAIDHHEFIAPATRPAHRGTHPGRILEMAGPASPGEARVLAVARTRLGAWQSLNQGQRNRLIRDLGIALATECGGLSRRQLAAAGVASVSGVGASLKPFKAGNHEQGEG